MPWYLHTLKYHFFLPALIFSFREHQKHPVRPVCSPPRHLHRIKRTSFYRQGNFFFFSCLQFYSRESLQLLHSWNGTSLQPAAEKQGNCRPFLVSGIFYPEAYPDPAIHVQMLFLCFHKSSPDIRNGKSRITQALAEGVERQAFHIPIGRSGRRPGVVIDRKLSDMTRKRGRQQFP